MDQSDCSEPWFVSFREEFKRRDNRNWRLHKNYLLGIRMSEMNLCHIVIHRGGRVCEGLEWHWMFLTIWNFVLLASRIFVEWWLFDWILFDVYLNHDLEIKKKHLCDKYSRVNVGLKFRSSFLNIKIWENSFFLQLNELLSTSKCR